MQDIIGQIHSEDASKLKPYIGCYVALDAVNHPLTPAIYSDIQRSRAMMGVNHPQLAGMLCLIKHLAAHRENPKKYVYSIYSVYCLSHYCSGFRESCKVGISRCMQLHGLHLHTRATHLERISIRLICRMAFSKAIL